MKTLVTLLLTMILAMPASGARPPEAEDAFLRAEVAVEKKDWELAIKYFEQARGHSPEDAEILVRLALAYDTAGGRDVLAIAWYRAYLAASQGDPDPSDVRTRAAKSIIKLETRIEVACRSLIRDARKIAGPYEPPYQAMRYDPATGALSSPPPSNKESYVLIASAEAAAGNAPAAYDFYQQPNIVLIASDADLDFITEALAQSGEYQKARDLLRSQKNRQRADIFIAMDYLGHGRFETASDLAASIGVMDAFRHSNSLGRLGIALAQAGAIGPAERLARLSRSATGGNRAEASVYYWIVARKARQGDMSEARQWLSRAEGIDKPDPDGQEKDDSTLRTAKAAAQAAVGDRAAARDTADRIGDPYLRALAHREIVLLEGHRKSAEIRDWSAFAVHYPQTVSDPMSEGRAVLLDLDGYVAEVRGSGPTTASMHLARGAIHLGVGLRRIAEKVSFWANR